MSGARETLLREGFLVCPAFVEEATRTRLEQEIDALIQASTNPTRLFGVVRDSNGYVTVMNNVDKHSDYLYDIARSPEWVEVAETLLGKPAQPLHVEYFAKPPGVVRPTPPHQDHEFYVDHFDDEMAITFWIALDDIIEQSGALHYRWPADLQLLPHVPSQAPDFDKELAPELIAADSGWRVAEVPRGGCVVHHSFVVHAAGSNRTQHARRAVAFNYRGSPWRAHLRTLAT